MGGAPVKPGGWRVAKLDLRERVINSSTPEPNTGCWFWDGQTQHDYGRMWVGGRRRLAHRVSFEAFHGEIPAGMCICHRCDVPCCVNPAHLFMGTHAENTLDMMRKGRNNAASGDRSSARLHPESRPRGEQHSRAILTAHNVLEIRRRVDGGESHRALAREFGVGHTTVRGAAAGVTWRHL